MKISSEELGKVLIAFGELLTKGGLTNMESIRHVDTGLPYTDVDNTNTTNTMVETGTFAEPAPEAVPETATGTFEAENIVASESINDKQRIAALEQELAKVQAQQNQSGLDLKPIKL